MSDASAKWTSSAPFPQSGYERDSVTSDGQPTKWIGDRSIVPVRQDKTLTALHSPFSHD